VSEQPLISIIVPVYNTAELLAKCVDSILSQTWSNIEVILVDDGSTDNSAEVIKHYQKQYPDKVKGLFQENAGQASARNAALDIMRGKFVSFVDSDDYILRDMLESLFEAAIKTNSQIVISDFQTVNENDEITGDYSSGDVAEAGVLVNENIAKMVSIVPQVTGKLFECSLFDNNTNRFPTGIWYEDLALLPLLVLSANKICKVPRYFYRYYKRVGSTTTTFSIKVLDALKALDYIDSQLVSNKFGQGFSKQFQILKHRTCYITAIRLCEVESKHDRKKGFLLLKNHIKDNDLIYNRSEIHSNLEKVVVSIASLGFGNYLYAVKKLRTFTRTKLIT
jgi:glycosyltransferase involved in cell wall biosynthesis